MYIQYVHVDVLACGFVDVLENEDAVSVVGGTFTWGGNGEEVEKEEERVEAGPATLSK